jgi:hypothetical protein
MPEKYNDVKIPMNLLERIVLNNHGDLKRTDISI